MSDQEELIARVRQLPWKVVVKLLKDAVEQHHQPREMPQAVLDWFDLNRKEVRSDEEAAVARAQMEAFRGRMEQFGEVAEPAFRDNFERAPIGVWWVQIWHYLRDGERWWLLRAYRDDGVDALESSKDDLRRLHKVVDNAGGDSRHLLIDAGDSLIWTWRA